MRATIIKAKQDERQESNIQHVDKFDGLYDDNILEPKYPFPHIEKMIEESNILPQSIESMSQNCDGFGHVFVENIKEQDKTSRIKLVMQNELEFLNNFFEYASYEMSFTEVRKRIRIDIESTGNAFMEVLKNMAGQYDGFNHVPVRNVRICKLSDMVDVKIKRRYPGSYEYSEVNYRRRFRTFVRLVNLNEKVYFKEFKDPRQINAQTGKEVTETDIEDAKRDNKEIRYATEIVWFSHYSSGSLYGIPRWIGCTPAILGSRAVEEDNYDFFESGISFKIIKVAGLLSRKTYKRIKDFLSNSRERRNRNKVLLLEAEIENKVGDKKTGNVPEIEILDIKERDEASHLNYDKDNRRKIRSTFRLPPVYVGETEDYNRATVKESKKIAEEQVFGPEKRSFDFFINRFIFPELDIKYYKFESKSAPVEDRSEQVDLIKVLGEIGLTIGESRKLIDKVADIELDDIDPAKPGNEWMNVPIKIAQYVMAMASRQTGFQSSNAGNQDQNKSKQKIDDFVNELKLLSKELRSS